MKKYIKSFVANGLFVCGFGPVAWTVIYAILASQGIVDTLSVSKVVSEIISVTLLAFIAGGIVVIYKIEKLPLVAATFIHAFVLYIDYIVIYLMNGWLGKELTPFLVFTLCFAAGFAVIWITVYFTTKKSTDKINDKLAAIRESERADRSTAVE